MSTQTLTREQRTAELISKKKELEKAAALEAEIRALESQLDNEEVDWPRVRVDSRGRPQPVGCKENTSALLSKFNMALKYNEMSKAIEFYGIEKLHRETALNDAIVTIRDLARKQGYSPEVAQENIGPISRDSAYHPVRDWILESSWDGVDRVEQLLSTVHTTESEEYKRMLITKWLISAVALVMYGTPHQNADHAAEGFQGVEGILVFKGRQGLGKTKWIERLTPARSGWVKDAVTLDPHNKDSVMLAVGHWIVELGEIDATFKKSDVAALKGFATSKVDIMRPPYAKAADTYERRTAFTGTVNDTTFLAESGESRRWWVLGVESIDSTVHIDVQQLWAQVYELYMQCVPFWLTAEDREVVYSNNKQYEQIDPLSEKLEAYVRNPLTVVDGGSESKNAQWLGAAAIVEHLLGRIGTKREANDASSWLLAKGFTRVNGTKKFKVVIDYSKKLDDERHRISSATAEVFTRTTA
ncbi:VapE domain-containing protein [Hydrogenophaga sp.]|uniref:VapE domain-containing protein n=1 Tax=Hydrogenophaga sp. TaxID=1904254 RepID=UPI002FC95CD8